jgi:hypothetical protein
MLKNMILPRPEIPSQRDQDSHEKIGLLRGSLNAVREHAGRRRLRAKCRQLEALSRSLLIEDRDTYRWAPRKSGVMLEARDGNLAWTTTDSAAIGTHTTKFQLAASGGFIYEDSWKSAVTEVSATLKYDSTVPGNQDYNSWTVASRLGNFLDSLDEIAAYAADSRPSGRVLSS